MFGVRLLRQQITKSLREATSGERLNSTKVASEVSNVDAQSYTQRLRVYKSTTFLIKRRSENFVLGRTFS